jgi:hypothetical protein
MYTRHEEMPMFDSRAGKVEAVYYNDVQTALKRLGGEIRLRIPELKHLDLILQKEAWIIVDRVLNDVPIAAWTNFETHHRNSLHEDIPCKLCFFHYAARMVLNRTLKAMDQILREELVADNARALNQTQKEK